MKKKILIIGNTDGLPGVKVDIEKYKDFFLSPFGGSWNETEIVEKINSPKLKILSELQLLMKFKLDYLIVIFSGHGGQKRQETVLEINPTGELMSESELKNIANRQLNIFDCCRAYSPTETSLTSEILNFYASSTSTRDRYEKRIMAASHQQISLYACAVGEPARDTSQGGVYSKNLLKVSRNIVGEFKLVGTAHEEASDLTTKESPTQHPEADLVRLLSSQQLIIGIKP